MKHILASSSPRRQELIKYLDIEYIVDSSDVEEVIDPKLSPEDLVMNLALQKAEDVAKRHKEEIVLGFDTLVILDGKPLGKPKDRDDAFNMLSMLSGRDHLVLTGCAIVTPKETVTFYGQAKVYFNTMSELEINEYLDTSEPFDKAGAYGIQGYGAKYINKIDGDYYTVMGMPLQKLYKTLRDLI